MNRNQIKRQFSELEKKFAEYMKTPGADPGKVFDAWRNIDRNLWLRLSCTGAASFYWRGSWRGKRVSRRLCRYNAITHDESFDRAAELAAYIADQVDKGQEPKLPEPERPAIAAATLEEVIETWLTLRQPTGAESIRNAFARHIYPHLAAGGQTVANELVEADFFRLVSRPIRAGTPEIAKKLLVWMKAAFRVGRVHAGVSIKEIAQIRVAELGIKSKSRTRTLSIDEARIVMAWTSSPARRSAYYQNFARVALLFGARSQEVRLSKITEWDLEAGMWTVPPEHSKTREEISRPILPELIPYIRSLVASARLNRSPYLLSQLKDNKAVSHFGTRLYKRLALPPFGFHDFRRTFSSGLADLNVPLEIRESLLGHARDQVEATYNRSLLIEQKLNALKVWSAALASPLGISNVHSLCAQ